MGGRYGEKLLYFDVETTGTDENYRGENGIWAVAGLYEYQGKIIDKFYLEMSPLPGDLIDPVALALSGHTEAELRAMTPTLEAIESLERWFGKHVNKFDPKDKFTMVAYNAQFDDTMMRELYKKLNRNYYGSWFHGYRLCVYNRVLWLAAHGKLLLPKYKQEIVCEHFGIKYKAHRADADVMACRKLYYKVKDKPEALAEDDPPQGQQAL